MRCIKTTQFFLIANMSAFKNWFKSLIGRSPTKAPREDEKNVKAKQPSPMKFKRSAVTETLEDDVMRDIDDKLAVLFEKRKKEFNVEELKILDQKINQLRGKKVAIQQRKNMEQNVLRQQREYDEKRKKEDPKYKTMREIDESERESRDVESAFDKALKNKLNIDNRDIGEADEKFSTEELENMKKLRQREAEVEKARSDERAEKIRALKASVRKHDASQKQLKKGDHVSFDFHEDEESDEDDVCGMNAMLKQKLGVFDERNASAKWKADQLERSKKADAAMAEYYGKSYVPNTGEVAFENDGSGVTNQELREFDEETVTYTPHADYFDPTGGPF